MQEILKRLYGEAVTEESLSTFNEELGKRFVSKADFNQRTEELKTLRSQVAGMEEELLAAREAVLLAEELRQKLQEAEERHAKELAAYTEQETKKQKKAALDKGLSESGARNLIAVKALLDFEKITFENGELTGLNEQLWELKQEYPYLFLETKQEVQFIQPAAKGQTDIADEDFKKLGYMERVKLKREQPELYRAMIQKTGGK